MNVLGLIKTILEVVYRLTKFVDDKQLLDAGQAINIAKVMTKIAKGLGMMNELRAETAKMTDQQLKDDLKGDDS